jgi:hypothetical protein
MEISHLSLLGAFAMLVFGIAEYIILQRILYLPMRQRYERAKVTAKQKMDPSLFWTALKVVNLVVLPVVGFIFGDPVLRPFFG